MSYQRQRVEHHTHRLDEIHSVRLAPTSEEEMDTWSEAILSAPSLAQAASI